MSGHRPRKTTAAARKQNAASAAQRGSTAAIPTAILAGTFAALASVFAKLTLDARTVEFLQTACNAVLAPTTPYCTSFFIAKEGETSPVRSKRSSIQLPTACLDYFCTDTACPIKPFLWAFPSDR
jgi:hypothetical protein